MPIFEGVMRLMSHFTLDLTLFLLLITKTVESEGAIAILCVS